MNATTSTSSSSDGADDRAGFKEYVTFVIADQLFGISVIQVQDVLSTHQITPIPMAPPEIAGSLNLRGRIVTVIDVRRRLGLTSRGAGEAAMSIVVEHDQDLYSLVVDSVGEVLALGTSEFEGNPPTLDPQFREFSAGIYRLDDKLLVVLDVDRLLDYSQSAAA
jgi:purine-binding chemotaxis protein CheW